MGAGWGMTEADRGISQATEALTDEASFYRVMVGSESYCHLVAVPSYKDHNQRPLSTMKTKIHINIFVSLSIGSLYQFLIKFHKKSHVFMIHQP